MVRYFVALFAIVCIGLPLQAHAETDPYGWNPYQYGKSITTNETSKPSNLGNSDNEIGVRYWYSSSEISYQVAKPQISSLDYKVDDSKTGEVFFYLNSKTSRYLFKGEVGFGSEQNGNVDDSDYNADGSKGSDTNSVIGKGRLFYVNADIGYKLSSLSTKSATTSFTGGVGYIQDVMTARGVTCKQTANGSFTGECNQGDVLAGSGVKALQNEAEWTTFRIGLENYWRPSRTISMHNSVVLIPYANFTNNDYHYLRTDLGTGQPNIIDHADYAYGLELESSLEFNILPTWTVNFGGRYWQFWAPETTTKVGNPQIATEKSYDWDYNRLGVFVGTGYKF